jgi:SAM-dependent methyltransferase
VVRRVVADLAPTTILELGCGLGAVGARLAGMGTYTAAEPDAESHRTAHDRIAPLGGTVLHGDHRHPDLGTGYDLVCAFEVLEHIEDDAAALAEWVPLARPGGHVLLSVPADPERFGPSDELVGHFRRYTAEQLAERLTQAGTTDVTVRHYGWPLGYLLDSVRDRLAGRRISTAAASAQERTRTSGRIFQPMRAASGGLIAVATAPFAAVQRLQPRHGPGLVALARRPRPAPPPK